jgi:SAM-dependent methyltransferase
MGPRVARGLTSRESYSTGSTMKRLIELAKKVPLDLGQRSTRWVTQGKVIARDLVPQARPGHRALDVGCREGDQTRWLERKGYEVTSIDVEKVYEKTEIVDAEKPLPYAGDTFDLIWCSEVIEHLEDPAFSASEMRRVLRPGGSMVLTTPNSFAWFFRPFYLAGVSPGALQHPGHKQFFRLDDIRKLFPRADVYGFFPYAIVKSTITSNLALLTPTFVIRETKPS